MNEQHTPASIAEQPVADPAAVQRLIRIGGTKLARQMIELFLQHGPERLEGAVAGQQQNDLVRVEHATHSLKSSAGNVGAHRLQFTAAAVEAAAQERRSDDLAGLVSALRREYDVATAALTTALGGLDA